MLLENAKKVKLKLKMTPEKTKTSSWISEKKMKQKLDTDETSQIRQWFGWPAKRQHINNTRLYNRPLFFKTFTQQKCGK